MSYKEDFQSYTPNAGVRPTGWSETGSILSGQVINNLGGGKGVLKQGYKFGLGGDGEFFALGGAGTGTTAFGSFLSGSSTRGIVDDNHGAVVAIYWQNFCQGENPNLLNSAGGVASTVPLGTSTTTFGLPLSWIVPEGDSTVSLWAGSTHIGGGTRMADTSIAACNQGGFLSWQVIWKYPSVVTTSGTTTGTFLGVQGAVWLDGTLLVTSGTVITDIPISNFGTGSLIPTPNQTFFNANANVGVISIITDVFTQSGLAVTTASAGTGTPTYFVDAEGMIWPFSGTGGGTSGQIPPVFAFNVTQAAVEVVKSHSNPSLRTTQAAVEVVKANIPIMRMTQVAVEIIKRSGGGWQVFEA